MKKIILTLALVAMGSVAYAQDNITATATIIEDLTVTKGADLEFGNITRGSASTIAYNAAGAGTFTVSGTPNVSVVLTLTLPANLTSNNGGADLPFTATAGIDTADIDPTSGSAFTTSAATPQTGTLNSSGEIFVSVGGSVTPGETHIGVYSGTITLNAVYD
jgi:hypothetical protein